MILLGPEDVRCFAVVCIRRTKRGQCLCHTWDDPFQKGILSMDRASPEVDLTRQCAEFTCTSTETSSTKICSHPTAISGRPSTRLISDPLGGTAWGAMTVATSLAKLEDAGRFNSKWFTNTKQPSVDRNKWISHLRFASFISLYACLVGAMKPT